MSRSSTSLSDVVIIGNNDLSSFSGFLQNDDRYQQLMNKIHDETLRATITPDATVQRGTLRVGQPESGR